MSNTCKIIVKRLLNAMSKLDALVDEPCKEADEEKDDDVDDKGVGLVQFLRNSNSVESDWGWGWTEYFIFICPEKKIRKVLGEDDVVVAVFVAGAVVAVFANIALRIRVVVVVVAVVVVAVVVVVVVVVVFLAKAKASLKEIGVDIF